MAGGAGELRLQADVAAPGERVGPSRRRIADSIVSDLLDRLRWDPETPSCIARTLDEPVPSPCTRPPGSAGRPG